MALKIGILALQGAFKKHQDMLSSLGVETLQVRYAHELCGCQGLILPGGESTVMRTQIEERSLQGPLQEFSENFPLFGTCAGLILMADLLGLLSIKLSRNAYGRQCASFSTPISFEHKKIDAFFIRAPRITAIGSERVHVLANLDNEPILVQQGFHLASTFHPELTNEPAIHQYFIKLCLSKQLPQRR